MKIVIAVALVYLIAMMLFAAADGEFPLRRQVGALFLWVLAAGSFFLPKESSAATITVDAPDSYGRIFVDVAGDFVAGDEKVFAEKIGTPVEPEKVIVSLKSQGGDFVSGLEIGDFIRLAGMATLVPPGETCASVCAIVWLAGTPRLVGDNAHVGFHGMYNQATGQEASLPDALTGTYLGYLQFSYQAVFWMLSARPAAMHWLTPETSAQYGILYQMLNPPRAQPVPKSPAPQQQTGPQATASSSQHAECDRYADRYIKARTAEDKQNAWEVFSDCFYGTLPEQQNPPARRVRPSFDCTKVAAADEVTSNSNTLSRLDQQLAQLYTTVRGELSAAEQRKLDEEEHTWLQRRALCQRNESCIADAYRSRIAKLEPR